MSTQRTPPGTTSQIFDGDSDGGDHTSVPASINVAKRPSKRPAVISPPIVNLPEGVHNGTNTGLRNIIEDVVQREMSNLLTKLNISMGTLLNTQLKSIKDEIQDVKESMSFMSSQYEEINRELKASKKSMQELQIRSDKLQPTINDINFRINQIEQAARSNNLEIQCMPEKKNESLVELVSRLRSIVNYKISEQNILYCARTAKYVENNVYPMIVGDLSQIDWSEINNTFSATQSTLCQTLIDFACMNNFKQYNDIPNSKGKALDLVFLEQSHLLVQVDRATDVLSAIDVLHPPLEILLKTKKYYNLIAQNCNFTSRNFFRADYEMINRKLVEIDWSQVFFGIRKVDDMVTIFYDKLNKIINEDVPIVKKRNKKIPKWFSSCLIKALHEKYKIRLRYKKHNNPLDKIELNICRKRCEKLSLDAYNSYIKRTEENIALNSKFFWSFVKSKRGSLNSYPAEMTDGSVTTSDGQDICNLFASHFSSVYSEEQSHQ
ncbi:unnamed protein product [Parnassius mnemosyne]|uniref:Exocyst complex component Exo70 n=1 Tax=Parnassius mnemosyne TaxID=213953 RepID=A0AAV1LK56_9NEOP